MAREHYQALQRKVEKLEEELKQVRLENAEMTDERDEFRRQHREFSLENDRLKRELMELHFKLNTPGMTSIHS